MLAHRSRAVGTACLAAVLALHAAPPSAMAQQISVQTEHDVAKAPQLIKHQPIPMRDGVQLDATIQLPPGPGPVPYHPGAHALSDHPRGRA